WLKSTVTSRASKEVLPTPAGPPVPGKERVLWRSNWKELTARVLAEGARPARLPPSRVRNPTSPVVAGSAPSAGPGGSAGPLAVWTAWSQEAERVLVASVIDLKANFSSSAGMPASLLVMLVTPSSVTKTVLRAQTATGLPLASFWVSTALS